MKSGIHCCSDIMFHSTSPYFPHETKNANGGKKTHCHTYLIYLRLCVNAFLRDVAPIQSFTGNPRSSFDVTPPSRSRQARPRHGNQQLHRHAHAHINKKKIGPRLLPHSAWLALFHSTVASFILSIFHPLSRAHGKRLIIPFCDEHLLQPAVTTARLLRTPNFAQNKPSHR